MRECDVLRKKIERFGYEVVSETPSVGRCVMDFKHPDIEVGRPAGYFLSSVMYDSREGRLRTTTRSKVTGFKEMYLDYCCEDDSGECIQTCRPHVHMSLGTVSVEASFREQPIQKFERLLEELRWPHPLASFSF